MITYLKLDGLELGPMSERDHDVFRAGCLGALAKMHELVDEQRLESLRRAGQPDAAIELRNIEFAHAAAYQQTLNMIFQACR